MGYIVHLTQVMSSFTPRMEYFPHTKPKHEVFDADIPGILEFFENDEEEAEEKNLMMNCSMCGDYDVENIAVQSVSIQSELKKFMQLQL